jgi:hypothetical protein
MRTRISRWTAAVAFLLLAGAVRAAEPPARIAVQATPLLKPGEAGKLVVSLAGTKGEPTPTLQPLSIEIREAAGLGAPATATVPAGATRAEVTIHAPKPGLWQIEARAPGLASGFATVVCIAPERLAAVRRPTPIPGAMGQGAPAPRPLPTQTPALAPALAPDKDQAPAIRPRVLQRLPPRSGSFRVERSIVREKLPSPMPVPVPVPVPPPAADAGPIPQAVPVGPGPIAPPPPPPAQGHVELKPQPKTVHRGPNGWEGQVEAFWFEGDVPGVIATDLSLSLLVDGKTGETRIAPTVLRIPGGQYKSDPATISARSADTAEVQALYAGGQSKPVEIDFLASAPAKVGFPGAQQPLAFRGLTAVATDVYVRLFDADGQQAVSAAGQKVSLAVQGPTGTRTYSGSVPPGDVQAKIPIELPRPGEYSLVASAPGLADSPALAVRFALDWLLLASALLGGVLGSLTRVLYRRERLWPKGLPRSLALGVAAALLVLLLSLFGVLSVLGDALPAAEALQKVSPTSLAGALLLGFLAGLGFDKIFARFLGARPSRRAKPPKPPASAPSPPPAPATPRP